MARLVLLLALFASYCANNPYGEFPEGRVIMTSMNDDPRTLDPARVGDTSSNAIASNIHDTPYEYHYLRRPLEIKPSMATGEPILGVTSLDGRTYQTFRFSIQKGLRYADDVCFAGGKGREIKIDDIIFAIKRSADSALDPFGLGILQGKVVGYDRYSTLIEEARKKDAEIKGNANLDSVYSQEIRGVRKVDDYTLELVLTEEFPQVIYFFTLTVGSPQPRECVDYYNGQNGRPTYDRHPATSGAFILTEWHANHRMILKRNPNYRKNDFYPTTGTKQDAEEGLLNYAGRELPLVDEIRMQVIKTGPPVWTLFDQGYLDRAGIPNEVYNQVVMNQDLTPEFRERGIRLDKEVDPATFYWLFNFQDHVMQNKILRQALSVVVDRNEMITRFMNGRGVPANTIIPPGMEGYDPAYQNPYGKCDLELAKQLLAKAGYPNGMDPATKRPLQIEFTTVANPGSTSLYRFYADSFAKLNVNLKILELDWPTVLQKKYKKDFQIIVGGWHADYPDPQNFLQLLYGPNGNTSYNEGMYVNLAYDALYMQMKNMHPGPARQKIIAQMNAITQEDAPVILMHHPISYGLSQKWFGPFKPHPTNTNQLKYRDVDPAMRQRLVKEWNRAPWTAYAVLIVILGALGALGLLTFRAYSKRMR